jgi:hypothetical protein
MIKLGYKASAKQFGPRELLKFGCIAKEVGFNSVFSRFQGPATGRRSVLPSRERHFLQQRGWPGL